jgi:hypothetical protein
MTKAYLVTASDTEGVVAKRYAGTAALAKATRNELIEKLGAKKSDVTIEDCDIPSDKNGLLAFINEVAAEADFDLEGPTK